MRWSQKLPFLQLIGSVPIQGKYNFLFDADRNQNKYVAIPDLILILSFVDREFASGLYNKIAQLIEGMNSKYLKYEDVDIYMSQVILHWHLVCTGSTALDRLTLAVQSNFVYRNNIKELFTQQPCFVLVVRLLFDFMHYIFCTLQV